MARTAEGAALTGRHRLLQSRISAGVLRDLLRLWGTVDPAVLGAPFDTFIRAGTLLVAGGRRASAAAAARYYVAFRRVEGVRGSAFVTPTGPVPDPVVVAAIQGAALSGIRNARARGATPAQAHANGFVTLSGRAAQLVAGGGRTTLLAAIQSDTAAEGWQRVTDGSPCAFCAMIAAQGIVAKDETGAGFEAHSHCGCTAEPAFEGSKVLPANERFAQAWQATTAGLSGPDALNAFRRAGAGA